MNALHSLKIVPFRNRSGSVSYRLTGTILGTRVRQNFPTRNEAVAELDKRTRDLSGGTTASVLTSLPERQVREAELATTRLPPGATLLQAADFFREHFRPLKPFDWDEAISAYRQHLLEERKTLETTADARAGDLRNFARFASRHHVLQTDRLRPETARAWIFEAGLGARTQRDRFDRLNQFCAWLVRERHATINPIEDLARPKVRVTAPPIFSPIQMAALLRAAWTDPEGPEMLPHFAICLLSGVRPGECMQLEPSDIFLDSSHPVIEVNKAKGGRSRRNAEIGVQLSPILTRCQKLNLAPGFFSVRKFNRIRRAAGLFDAWVKDIERHTFASYHYELHHDIESLAKNMGNSPKVLFTSYIRAVPHADAIAAAGITIDWSEPRRPTLERRRIDLWADLPENSLAADQRTAVQHWKRKRRARSGSEPPT